MNKFLIVVIALILSYAVAFRVGSTLETGTGIPKPTPPKTDICEDGAKDCMKGCNKERCWDPCDDGKCMKDCKDDCEEKYRKCKKISGIAI